jgi:outer membrane protein assembly factor BamB
VTTFHYDNARDGLNAQETNLSLKNVNSTQFGKIGFDAVDGLVDAQPLFLANLNAGGTVRNVLLVATEHDSVYAFDADTGAQIWKTSVLGSGETTSDSRSCGQVVPEIGIVETPVIDRKQGPNGTVFIVAMSRDGSANYHQRLHALDVSTGAEIAGSPTEITATYPGRGANSSNGNVVFDPGQYKERAALLLLNGTVYMGFSSHCDIGLYTGWVMAYSESTLKQTQVLNLTPNGDDGSIWMSGDGIAADSSGNLFLLDANGTFDTTFDANGFPASGDYGNAMVKLATSGKLAVADYFQPYNTVSESSADQDLGSGGEVLLPDQTDAQGQIRHLIVGGGKDTNLYVGDRDNLGKFNARDTNNQNGYQELPGVGPLFSTPAYFNGVLYVGSVGSPLRAFPVTSAKLATAPSTQSAVLFAYPGTSPAISANGTQDGIVWAVESGAGSPAVLHAYDAADLTHELYNSTQAAKGRDAFGNGNKYITPLVVNGKVYVGTPTGVAVFGQLAQ